MTARSGDAANRVPLSEDGLTLRRYDRPREAPPTVAPLAEGDFILPEEVEAACAASALSAGARDLLRGLLAVGDPAVFGGGGAGIEYGALLKTAARPEYLAAHVREASAHLHEHRVDLLMVPGMSGYPVGAMYAIVSGIPAVLLKKQTLAPEREPDAARYPPGSFVIPSYTGDGDVVMSADPGALPDIVDGIVARELAAQADLAEPRVTVRVAGADDIIDKATMSQAVSESALVLGKLAIERSVARHRARSGDARPIASEVRVVTWVTPLIKGYNRPHEALARWFGIAPFAGINVTSIHLDPPAIGIEGLGIVGFADRES